MSGPEDNPAAAEIAKLESELKAERETAKDLRRKMLSIKNALGLLMPQCDRDNDGTHTMDSDSLTAAIIERITTLEAELKAANERAEAFIASEESLRESIG